LMETINMIRCHTLYCDSIDLVIIRSATLTSIYKEGINKRTIYYAKGYLYRY
jgi:hypothetical protein